MKIYKLLDLAKEKGLKEPLITWDDASLNNMTLYYIQTWLRDTHGLEVNVQSDMLGFGVYIVRRSELKRIKVPNNIFQHYEEALEAGILESLKQI